MCDLPLTRAFRPAGVGVFKATVVLLLREDLCSGPGGPRGSHEGVNCYLRRMWPTHQEELVGIVVLV